MSKKVLAIYYTQSGQLGEIVDHFSAPLMEAGISIEKVSINLSKNYPFPWTTNRFFSVMPDSVLDVTAELAPFELKETSYDLIILGYQAWFLSPSIPFNSLLHHPGFVAILKNTPVITITGARNMWLSAFLKVKKLILAAGTKLVGNIALVDRHANPVSFVTIFHWMLHGKKDRYLNIFPLPGVSDADISHTSVFGEHVLQHLKSNEWNGLQNKMVMDGAVKLKYNLMIIESVASKMFKLWANFIVKRKNRDVWLKAFKYYLLIAFFIGAPILLTIDAIFIRPFSSRRIRAKKRYYLNLE
ncbi:MAG TPA: hypothetical protein VET23_10730 [Chitinophagaceae bacterium]|nr:hypothetical protein [Chitinophagaceae bacterium]